LIFNIELYAKLYCNEGSEQNNAEEKRADLEEENKEDELPQVLKEEVKEAIRRMKSGKAPRPDKVENKTLKALAKELTKPLTNVFNNTIETERIPEQWKISEINIYTTQKRGLTNDRKL